MPTVVCGSSQVSNIFQRNFEYVLLASIYHFIHYTRKQVVISTDWELLFEMQMVNNQQWSQVEIFNFTKQIWKPENGRSPLQLDLFLLVSDRDALTLPKLKCNAPTTIFWQHELPLNEMAHKTCGGRTLQSIGKLISFLLCANWQLLPPFERISRFSFSRCINFTMALDIYYV